MITAYLQVTHAIHHGQWINFWNTFIFIRLTNTRAQVHVITVSFGESPLQQTLLIWNTSSWRHTRLSSILTWTGKTTFFCGGHGNLPFTPQEISGNLYMMIHNLIQHYSRPHYSMIPPFLVTSTTPAPLTNLIPEHPHFPPLHTYYYQSTTPFIISSHWFIILNETGCFTCSSKHCITQPFPLACYNNHPYPHNIKSHWLAGLQDPERLRQRNYCIFQT